MDGFILGYNLDGEGAASGDNRKQYRSGNFWSIRLHDRGFTCVTQVLNQCAGSWVVIGKRQPSFIILLLNQYASKRFEHSRRDENNIKKLKWGPAHKRKGEKVFVGHNTRRLLWNYLAFDLQAGVSGWKDGNSCFVDFSPIMEDACWISKEQQSKAKQSGCMDSRTNYSHDSFVLQSCNHPLSNQQLFLNHFLTCNF